MTNFATRAPLAYDVQPPLALPEPSSPAPYLAFVSEHSASQSQENQSKESGSQSHLPFLTPHQVAVALGSVGGGLLGALGLAVEVIVGVAGCASLNGIPVAGQAASSICGYTVLPLILSTIPEVMDKSIEDWGKRAGQLVPEEPKTTR